MTTFTIVLEEQVEASSINEAMRIFQRSIVHPMAPSMDVKVFEGDDSSMLSARDIEYRRLPKRQFMWRSKDYPTFHDAWKEGAIYPMGMYAPDLTQINAALKVADNCLGMDVGLKVEEW